MDGRKQNILPAGIFLHSLNIPCWKMESSKFKYETQSNFFGSIIRIMSRLSQGFKIELNDMNGKMKAQATYAETDSIHPMKYSLNFYNVEDDKALQKALK